MHLGQQRGGCFGFWWKFGPRPYHKDFPPRHDIVTPFRPAYVLYSFLGPLAGLWGLTASHSLLYWFHGPQSAAHIESTLRPTYVL